jgi:hypothetical protein
VQLGDLLQTGLASSLLKICQKEESSEIESPSGALLGDDNAKFLYSKS